MTHQEINRYICEEIEKKCWHEWEDGQRQCKYCGSYCTTPLISQMHPNYFSDSEYLPLLRKCSTQDWWSNLVYEGNIFIQGDWVTLDTIRTLNMILSPNQLLPALVKWWKEEK